MNLQKDWLWDRKITVQRARQLLKRPEGPQFQPLAALLLSRKNSPQEVFKFYLTPLVFLQNWNFIKAQMRKDSWNDPRIEFWQAIYENLSKRYKKRGIIILKKRVSVKPQDEFCKSIAEKIKLVRKQNGLTQARLAKKLKVSQQIISRIESGNENISLLTLKKIVEKLGAKLQVEIT